MSTSFFAPTQQQQRLRMEKETDTYLNNRRVAIVRNVEYSALPSYQAAFTELAKHSELLLIDYSVKERSVRLVFRDQPAVLAARMTAYTLGFGAGGKWLELMLEVSIPAQQPADWAWDEQLSQSRPKYRFFFVPGLDRHKASFNPWPVLDRDPAHKLIWSSIVRAVPDPLRGVYNDEMIGTDLPLSLLTPLLTPNSTSSPTASASDPPSGSAIAEGEIPPTELGKTASGKGVVLLLDLPPGKRGQTEFRGFVRNVGGAGSEVDWKFAAPLPQKILDQKNGLVLYGSWDEAYEAVGRFNAAYEKNEVRAVLWDPIGENQQVNLKVNDQRPTDDQVQAFIAAARDATGHLPQAYQAEISFGVFLYPSAFAAEVIVQKMNKARLPQQFGRVNVWHRLKPHNFSILFEAKPR